MPSCESDLRRTSCLSKHCGGERERDFCFPASVGRADPHASSLPCLFPFLFPSDGVKGALALSEPAAIRDPRGWFSGSFAQFPGRASDPPSHSCEKAHFYTSPIARLPSTTSPCLIHTRLCDNLASRLMRHSWVFLNR